MTDNEIAAIPEAYRDLLDDPVVVTLVTMMPDGQPQATPVWANWDGQLIWVNTARGRQKDENMTERPRVTVLAIDPQNPYRYMEVRGDIAEVTEDGAAEHINQLSHEYFGRDYYQDSDPGSEQRVIFKIAPRHVVAHG